MSSIHRGSTLFPHFRQALIKILFGTVVSYEDVAIEVGILGATRAVGSAAGRNPISFIISCHQVIHSLDSDKIERQKLFDKYIY